MPSFYPRSVLLVEAVASLPVVVNLWQTQNMYWTMLQPPRLRIPHGAEDTSDMNVLERCG